jgi:hypothetical protein
MIMSAVAPTGGGGLLAEGSVPSANLKSWTLVTSSVPSGEPGRKSTIWNEASILFVT